MAFVVLVILALAVARASHLVTAENPGRAIRGALSRRYPPRNLPMIRETTGLPIPDSGQVTPHWTVCALQSDWAVSAPLAAAAAVGAHYAGLVRPWALVGFGAVAIACAAPLLLSWKGSNGT